MTADTDRLARIEEDLERTSAHKYAEATIITADLRWLIDRLREAEGSRDRYKGISNALLRWKKEALPVIEGLQELGHALELRLGAQTTGPQAAEAAKALRDRAEKAEAALARVEALADHAEANTWAMDHEGNYFGKRVSVSAIRAAMMGES